MITEKPAAPAGAAAARRAPDWPGDGDIDRAVQDLPHASSTLEWWYVNAHLRTTSGRDLSLFASFFRTAVGHAEGSEAYVYAHALTWAVVDPAGGRYQSESLIDKDAPAIVRQQLERASDSTDPVFRRALLEVAQRNEVPLPDRLLDAPCVVASDELLLDYDGRRFEKMANGSYGLLLHDAAGQTACELTLEPTKPAIRHGQDGMVRGNSDESMFYYFVPRCAVRGTITLDGRVEEIAAGSAWYDHEFGRPDTDVANEATVAQSLRRVSWDWIGAQLDSGWDLSIYSLVDDASGLPCGQYALLIDPQGRAQGYSSFTFEGSHPWTSSRTFISYPTCWSIRIPGANLTLEVRAALPAQELMTIISRPSFWEGRVDVQGSHAGVGVTGRGFVERRGFERTDSVSGFFAAVSRATYRSVDRLLPMLLEPESAAPLVASRTRPDYLDDLDLQQVARALVHPVRAIVDRGGKAWRSYILLACCDAVGGDSQRLLDWLALPELMHVGSLIVDDVEDGSLIRRGGPAAHVQFGTALAINAGSACYFLPHLFLQTSDVDDARKLRIYELYMEGVRAAHTGQALDLSGFRDVMPRVVSEGAGEELHRRVRAVHRLKSAAPASCLARAGALLGGGTEQQIAALGAFVEAVGVAFQVVDDVLNITGFENDLKTRGEDLRHGKITMPVAVAMERLDLSGRTELWDILRDEARPAERVDRAVELLGESGALDACRAEAEGLIEDGWRRLDPLLAGSHAKLMLRAFGWFVLDRHY